MKGWVIFLVVGLLVGWPLSWGGTPGQGGGESQITDARAGPEPPEAVEAGSPGPQGVTTAWVRRYNGPANGDDNAFALAVDSQGNVYVTGHSDGGSGTAFDYATVKYDANGNRQWVRRYNGPANARDSATAIAVDGQGNVYVTGESFGATGVDYATLKYDTNGHLKWVRRYNGPGNYDDRPCALVVDAQGNVYVTGNATYPNFWSLYYATLKYDTNGHLKWVRRHKAADIVDYATALAVDGQGNVYVSGDTVACLKYDSNGNLKWIRRHPGGYVAYALAVDGQGNVYVTGQSYGGSATGNDYATLKYDTNGHLKWVRRYNGSGNADDKPSALAVDSQGNVYVTGWSTGSGTGYDYATIKYDTKGNQKWVKRYNGPGYGDDSATAIAVDGQGNVYVTGSSTGSGTGYDYATIKYDTNGNQKWVKRYNGPGNGADFANAIAVDGQGNVYVTGQSDGGSATGNDYATIKYRP
jgi:hypothetical protein